MAKQYPESVKKSICKQILDGFYTTLKIAKMNNIPYTTIFTWKSQLLPKGDKVKKKQRFSPQEKLDMLFATASMSEAEVSEFCRKKGIYPHMLETWKEACLQHIDRSHNRRTSDKVKKALKDEVKKLKKEIRRKDKALAETTALLVLKKWNRVPLFLGLSGQIKLRNKILIKGVSQKVEQSST